MGGVNITTMPTILGLDTSTDACSVALWRNSQVIERFQIAPRRHAELILPLVHEVLAEANLTLAEIELIAFGRGPGSFMGVRIATGIAQGLSFGMNCKVIAVSSLQALSQIAFEQHGVREVIAAWDARMDEIYWGGYRVDDHGLMRNFIAENLSPPEKIVIPEKMKSVAAGNAWKVYADRLNVLQNFSAIYPDLYPSASAIVRLANQLYAENQAVFSFEAMPTYLRDQVVRC